MLQMKMFKPNLSMLWRICNAIPPRKDRFAETRTFPMQHCVIDICQVSGAANKPAKHNVIERRCIRHGVQNSLLLPNLVKGMTAHNSCLKNHQTCLKPWHTIFPAWLAWSTMDTRVWAAHINWSRSRISIATAIPTRGAILVWSWPRRSTIADNTACNIGALNDNLVMMFCQLNVVRWPGLVSRKMEHFSERVVHNFLHETLHFFSDGMPEFWKWPSFLIKGICSSIDKCSDNRLVFWCHLPDGTLAPTPNLNLQVIHHMNWTELSHPLTLSLTENTTYLYNWRWLCLAG